MHLAVGVSWILREYASDTPGFSFPHYRDLGADSISLTGKREQTWYSLVCAETDHTDKSRREYPAVFKKDTEGDE